MVLLVHVGVPGGPLIFLVLLFHNPSPLPLTEIHSHSLLCKRRMDREKKKGQILLSSGAQAPASPFLYLLSAPSSLSLIHRPQLQAPVSFSPPFFNRHPFPHFDLDLSSGSQEREKGEGRKKQILKSGPSGSGARPCNRRTSDQREKEEGAESK